MDVRAVLASLGGIAPARDLTAAGVTTGLLRSAVRSGTVVRFRKGWYAIPGLSEEIIESSRIGGVLACASAARHHGLWVLDASRLHVAVHGTASRLRHPRNFRRRLTGSGSDALVHWTGERASPYQQVETVEESILSILDCQGPEAAFIVFESALRQGRFTTIEEFAFRDALPASASSLFEHADDRADSGSESALKLAFIAAKIPFRQQVVVPKAGTVDFVIGDALAIEADSREFHADPLKDRRKDALLSLEGYRTQRYMYSQIVYELDTVMAAIRAAIDRGDHLR